MVNAPTGLAAGAVAYVNISPTLPSAEWAAEGAAALQVSIDGGTTWTSTAQLEFVGGVTGPQTVMLRAAPTPQGDTYSRDESIIVASSVVSADQPALDSLILPTVKVIVEAIATGLFIDSGAAPTTIVAGATAATRTSYSYNLSLSSQPTTPVTVTLSDANAASDGVVLMDNGVAVTSVTFNSADWNTPQTITVTSTLPGVHGEIPVDIAQSINGVDVGDVNLEIAASNAAGVLLLTPQGQAQVSSTQTYSYQMVLTKAPVADVTVDLLGDGQTIASSSASGFDAASQTYTFTAADWNVPVTITLAPNPSYTPPTDTGTGSGPATILTFPVGPHTLAEINGPLVIDGGTEPGQPTIVAAVGLPYETHNMPVTDTASGGQSSNAIDVLQVYDDEATTGQTGEITTIAAGDVFAGVGDNISGLDLPGANQTVKFVSPVTGLTEQYEGGVNYVNLDAVEIFLGAGNDTFTIDTTAPTINVDDGLRTLTVVEGGGGSNTIDVTASSDPLVLYGNESASGVEYNSTETAITGNAYAFANFGSDVIDASGATGTVVIVGGPDGNTLTGGSGVNWIFGNLGGDTIAASGSQNYILGNSNATVGVLVDAPIQPAGNPDAQAIDLSSRLLTIDNSGTTAAANAITVTGSGASDVIGDYGIIDIVGQSPGVVDPFDSLGPEAITTIESVNTALGADNTISVGNNDVVIGGAGNDTIIVGSSGSDVIFGDNGEADYSGGVLVEAKSLDPLHSGANTISGPIVNGLPTPGGSGRSVVIGGAGADTIDLGGSSNTIIGNDGEATFLPSGRISTVTSLDPSYRANNVISASGGDNVIIGGSGSNQITLGGGGNVVVGDNGNASFTAGVLAFVTTSDETYAGNNDIVVNGNGANDIFGGSGADSITVNGSGANVIFGDNGEASFTNGVLTEIETIGQIAAATATAASVESGTGGTVYGGDDTIKVGDGANVIVGGLGADAITTGNGANVVLGDSGAATFNPLTGKLVQIESTFAGAAVGGTRATGTSSNDTITLGVGDNVVIGGAGADQIVLGSGSDVVLGDDGQANFTNGALTSAFSTDGALGYGGNDTISGPGGTPGGSGHSTIIGGIGADTITIGGNKNTIIGDDGQAAYSASGQLLAAQTIDPGIGGDDLITVVGDGNVIFGGAGDNRITVETEPGSTPSGNVIVGANGYANYTDAILTQIASSAPADAGNNIIAAGDGDNIVIGGSGADRITLGDGSNVVLGDNGEIDFNPAGALTTVKTTDPSYGGEDTIFIGVPGAASTGQNIVMGGVAADSITVNGAGDNIVLGDDGEADFTNGFLSAVYSTDVTVGGDNSIAVNGNGANIVIGGLGADAIMVPGSGANIVIGDNGHVDFGGGFVLDAYTIAPAAAGGGTVDTGIGADDAITVGAGDNLIFGGSGADAITAGAGNNAIVGDNGQATFSGGILSTLQSTDVSTGGDDTISAGGGSNVVIGGTGANRITLGDGQNAVVGGNGFAQFTSAGFLQAIYSTAPTASYGGTPDTGSSNANFIRVGNGDDAVIGGSGADQIVTGNGDDYIIGDNGEVQYLDVAGVNIVSRAQSTFQLFGANDSITAGGGTDSIIGGVGADTIVAGNGVGDIVLGDNGEIVQAFDAAGNPVRNTDGSLHRDIVLEEIATIIGSVLIDSAGDAAAAAPSAYTSADLVLLAGAFNADGSQVILPSSGSRPLPPGRPKRSSSACRRTATTILRLAQAPTLS